jgi:hypothetical protein
MEDRRGWPMALFALAVYGYVLLSVSLDYEGTVARSHRCPVADSALVIPLAFIALAYLTDLTLWVCALISLALWVVTLPLAMRRRHAPRPNRRGRDQPAHSVSTRLRHRGGW